MLANLGGILFTPRKIPFNKLHLETKAQWIEHKTLNDLPIIQPGQLTPQEIELSGTILSDFHDGIADLKSLHELVISRKLVPLTVTSEDKGVYLGMWAIVSVSEDRSIFDSKGRAKKIDFHLELLKVSNASNPNITK